MWNWDVAEAFIGSDFERIGRYKEFQVSPQGEWVDLDIDRDNSQAQQGMRMELRLLGEGPHRRRSQDLVRRDEDSVRRDRHATAGKGRELRIGLFRIAGLTGPKKLYAWRPTGQATFHVPQAFGILRLR